MNEVYSENHIVVVEAPPCIRTLIVSHNMATDKIRPYGYFQQGDDVDVITRYYRLALPWQVYIFTPLKICLAFRNSQLTQTDQELCYPHLWNVNSRLSVCLGNVHYIGEKIESQINAVWSSVWNINEIQRLSQFSTDPRVATWERWAQHTKNNADFITTVPWAKFGQLDHLLMRLRGN